MSVSQNIHYFTEQLVIHEWQRTTKHKVWSSLDSTESTSNPERLMLRGTVSLTMIATAWYWSDDPRKIPSQPHFSCGLLSKTNMTELFNFSVLLKFFNCDYILMNKSFIYIHSDLFTNSKPSFLTFVTHCSIYEQISLFLQIFTIS